MRQKIKILSILMAVLLFGALAIASGSDSGAQKVGEVSNDSATTNESVSESNQSQVNNNESSDQADGDSLTNNLESEQSKILHVGDTYSDNGVDWTYLSSGDYYSDNQFMQPGEGNKYIFIQLHVANNSSSDESVSAFSFECYADGYSASQFYGGEDDLSGTLSPGRSTSGYIYYEVPESAAEIEIEYSLNVFSNDKLIFVYDGNMDSGIVPETNTVATENAFHIGDIVEDGDVRLTYLSCSVYESDNEFIQPKDGYVFVSYEFEVENISNSDQMISSFNFDCYADGVNCDGSYLRDDDLQAPLSPGRKAKGSVTFEVPVTVSVLELEYLSNVWTGDRIVFAVQ